MKIDASALEALTTELHDDDCSPPGRHYVGTKHNVYAECRAQYRGVAQTALDAMRRVFREALLDLGTVDEACAAYYNLFRMGVHQGAMIAALTAAADHVVGPVLAATTDDK